MTTVASPEQLTAPQVRSAVVVINEADLPATPAYEARVNRLRHHFANAIEAEVIVPVLPNGRPMSKDIARAQVGIFAHERARLLDGALAEVREHLAAGGGLDIVLTNRRFEAQITLGH